MVAALQGLDIRTAWAACFALLLACGFGLPVPEDVTLLTSGYLTYVLIPADGSKGSPGAHAAMAVAIGMLGVLVGDGVMFTLGARLGGRLQHRFPFSRILRGGRREQAEAYLKERGARVLFAARFMPGLRSVVFFTSGLLKTPFSKFLLFDGLAALLSVPALVLSSWYFGAQIDKVRHNAELATKCIGGLVLAFAILTAIRAFRGRKSRKASSESAPRT
jgi:membrane protein DedA with SNARE-associated domain